jgi:uncharacterized phage protein gp47/JayE
MAGSLAALLVQQTKAQIYAAALSIATGLGLPVTSWRAGDTTRSLYYVESTFLETLQNVVIGFIQSGFLDYVAVPNADGSPNPWLAILAKQVYNYDVPVATFATTTETLTNPTGAVFEIEAGDLTFKSSTTGKTYHNTTGGVLAGSGGTLDVTVVADEAGAASSAAATEIDTIVSGPLNVTCSNATAAVGTDQEDPAVTVQNCRNKLGSLSPNGPASAYSFVALASALTGIKTITRARPYPDSDTGDVLLYVAGASGAVSGGDVTAVQNAIQIWATPLTITPTVQSASNVTVAVTYTLWVYKSVNLTSAQIQAAVQTALETLFATRPIGGDIIPPATTGALYATLIESTIRGVVSGQAFRVLLSAPSSDTALTNGQVPVLGTVTPTINFVDDPK